jgi:hypothetical protein
MKVTMASNVGKTLSKKGYVSQRVGLELEYEHCKGAELLAPSDKWHTEIDHSLRTGGLEFISKPLASVTIRPAILSMLKQAASIKARVTHRCGLHVHLNATHMTWGQLFQFATYYTLLEPYLFKTFADGRQDSHFCVPTWYNTALTEYMYNDGQKLRSGITIPDTTGRTAQYTKSSRYLLGNGGRGGGLSMVRTPKYAALNVSALKKFGTLEFRQAPSSMSASFIEEWARLLMRIQVTAMKYNDATDIIREYDRSGVLTLCEKVGFSPRGYVHVGTLEDAADAATIMAGHIPVNWKDLKWEVA